MNSKQRKTLDAIFTDPVSGTIRWDSIEALFVALGCERIEGKGSSVRFNLNGVVGYFHRPHPAKEAKKYHIVYSREFLIKAGISG